VNPVARFESFIERLMERTFTRATRSHIQPVEIGKRLVRVMDASERAVGMEGVIVPNVYDVFLSPYDYRQLEPMRQSVSRNLESHVGRVARQRQYRMVSLPVVRLHLDPDMAPGGMRIDPHTRDVEPAEQEMQHTSVLPRVDAPAGTAASGPSLRVDGHPYSVLRSPTKLGRLADNDIVLDDRRVSRHHAEVLQRSGRWLVRDAGSTNGTAVNGKLIKESVLKPGDTISLGGLEITWEQ
jgi:hypothetical protein